MTTHPNTHAITVTHLDHVATIVLERPPHNFVDAEVICQLADELDDDLAKPDRHTKSRAAFLYRPAH